MNDPLVSIIMPARNVEKYIRDAIGSVLNQSYQNWELLVIENDSRDKTLEAAREFQDQRIRVFQTPSPGLSNARNMGIAHAEGSLICFLDGDDLLPENSLKSRVELLQQNPDVMFVDGKVDVYNYDLTELRTTWQPSFRGNPYREMALLNPRCFCGITWMIRKSALHSVTFDTTWTHLEDRLFFISIAQQGNYDYVDERVYNIRRRPGSLMANLKALELAYRRFLKYVQDLGIYDEATKIKEQKQFHRMFYRTYLKHLQPVKASWHLIKRIRRRNS
jgi:glycosyltransferase involved in cell wall biosynthesis